MQEVEKINKDFYDKVYKKRPLLFQLIYPFISFDQQSKSKRNFRLLRPYIREKSKDNAILNYLDYGFGHGSLLLKIPRKANLYGCDISEEAVRNFPRVAKMLGKEVKTFTVAEAPKITSSTKFDIISLSHVLEHVPNDVELLSSLVETLNPKGLILINLPINEVWDDPKHVRRYDKAAVLKLAENCGLTVTEVLETGRLSGFFLTIEKVRQSARIAKVFIRAARLLFAIMPLTATSIFESLLSDQFKAQHIIVLAVKK